MATYNKSKEMAKKLRKSKTKRNKLFYGKDKKWGGGGAEGGAAVGGFST